MDYETTKGQLLDKYLVKVRACMYSRISVLIITVLLAAVILASTLQAATAQQQQPAFV